MFYFFFLGLLVFALFSLVSFFFPFVLLFFSFFVFIFTFAFLCYPFFVFLSKKDIQLSVNDIDSSHRIGKAGPGKERSTIVKFVQCNDRRKVFSNKERLKDFGISVTKNLTSRGMEELSKACNKHGFKNAWILFKKNGSTKATTLSCG